jgi:hypothetical protein
MKQVEIKRLPGVFFKLDDEVAEKIGHWGWNFNEKTGYVFAHLPGSGASATTGKNVYCSHAVLWVMTGEWPEKGKVVDHINHDKLDNQVKNLRIVTHSLNQRNQVNCRKSVSKFKGVSFDKRWGWWQGQAVIKDGDQQKHLAGSNTRNEEEAARARDCLVYKIGGFLLPNFPDESFEEKWEKIGERQRQQILHSLEKNGIKERNNCAYSL